jgi:hypothetical protein
MVGAEHGTTRRHLVRMRIDSGRIDVSPKSAGAGMLLARPDMPSGKVSMSFQSRDSTFRTTQQLGELFGRIVGLRRAGNLDDASKMLKDGGIVIFCPMWDSIRGSDVASEYLGSSDTLDTFLHVPVGHP